MGTVSRRRFTHHEGAIARFDAAIAHAHAEVTQHPLGEGSSTDRDALAPLRLACHRTPQRCIDPLAMHLRESLHVDLQRLRQRRPVDDPVALPLSW